MHFLKLGLAYVCYINQKLTLTHAVTYKEALFFFSKANMQNKAFEVSKKC